VRTLQDVPESVRVEADLLGYLVALSRATRERSECDVGVSPRGTQRLFEAARVRAVLSGREYVAPEDVKRVARPVLAHRLVLTPDAAVEGVDKRSVIDDVLDDVPVPTV
jgi:MoxR-like ATPase